MKISSFNINMESSHKQVEKRESREELRMWGNVPTGLRLASARSALGLGIAGDMVTITQREHPPMSTTDSRSSVHEAECIRDELDSITPEVNLTKLILEAMTGKKIQVNFLKGDSAPTVARDPEAVAPGAIPESGDPWGVVFNRFESHYEMETMSFASEGSIETSDGRKIDFSLDILMSREFYSEVNESFRAGNGKMVDPLVIHFGAVHNSLTQATFRFDLNADGVENDIAFVRPESALLALDVNGDGIINDGGELFGPTTGNGFSELAAYDEDGNGWIDENDSVFDRLSLWFKDGAGNDEFKSLRAAGVGAIYLGNVESPFALKDSSNNLQGQVARSGVVIMESGQARSIQQVDLVV